MFFNMINNALDTVATILSGELPSREKVARLISDGVDIAMIATLFGVGVDVIEGLIDAKQT